jgi:hypothetical protein
VTFQEATFQELVITADGRAWGSATKKNYMTMAKESLDPDMEGNNQ